MITVELITLASGLGITAADSIRFPGEKVSWPQDFGAFISTIPDKKVGTRSKFSPPSTFNVDNQVIFALFVGKNALFSNID